MITGEIRLGGQLDGVAQKIRSVPVRAERLSADAEPYARWEEGALVIGIPEGAEGYSPIITVTEISGGHRVTITDAEHPEGIGMDVMDGDFNRVTGINSSVLARSEVIEAVGIPTYVSDVTQYSAYALTDTGWYSFARLAAKDGTTVTEQTTVTGAAGCIATPGAAYVDVAVRFGVAAESQRVTVNWGSESDTYVFKATDLAVRNLDYRTTFYVYDLAPFVSWTFAPTKDATVADGKKYYTKSGSTYTLAELTTGAACVCYYELDDDTYVLTEDETFVDGKTYYTTTDGTTYTAATVTAGDTVPTVYYNHSKLTIQGMTRNITYRLDETIDCPSEVILPAIEDETHGCWFEFQLRHSGKYSMTLTVPEGVKVATEHTQAEDTGFNLIDLHYMCIDNIKMWRFMNTHSSIPTS